MHFARAPFFVRRSQTIVGDLRYDRETDLGFAGTVKGGKITGTVDFTDGGYSWSDAWYGDLYGGTLYGAFKGGKVLGADLAWDYEGAFTLEP